MTAPVFIEVDHHSIFKDQQVVGGDAFLTRIIKNEGRVISVLSDGLGSGIKASVLSILTATMALNYVSKRFDVVKTAKIIMDTLPVCSRRKLSYSTFTIVDMDSTGETSVIEYGNPRFIFLRGTEVQSLPYEALKVDSPNSETLDDPIYYSRFKVQKGDRLLLMSDGVTQSGIAKPLFPMGWGRENVCQFATEIVAEHPEISSGDLSKKIIEKACQIEGGKAADDTTCGVIYVRTPRRTLLMTGPPVSRKRDVELGKRFRQFKGKKVICGGTTANIISRECHSPIEVDLKTFTVDVPPTSHMHGADLVTEGSLTLGKVLEILEKDLDLTTLKPSGATEMIQIFLDSDIIRFVVGTRINEIHQDPNIPVELEIRRSLIKRIIRLLEEKYLKETQLTFI